MLYTPDVIQDVLSISSHASYGKLTDLSKSHWHKRSFLILRYFKTFIKYLKNDLLNLFLNSSITVTELY